MFFIFCWYFFITFSKKSFRNTISLSNILRKTIEGYLDSVPSLTFNTIKTKVIMHAFHSSNIWNQNEVTLQWLKYSTCPNGATLYTEKSWAFNDWNPFLLFVIHNAWLQNHFRLSAKGMTPNFVVCVSVLIPICCHIGWGMPYMCIFGEEVVMLLGAITDKWLWTLVCGQN